MACLQGRLRSLRPAQQPPRPYRPHHNHQAQLREADSQTSAKQKCRDFKRTDWRHGKASHMFRAESAPRTRDHRGRCRKLALQPPGHLVWRLARVSHCRLHRRLHFNRDRPGVQRRSSPNIKARRAQACCIRSQAPESSGVSRWYPRRLVEGFSFPSYRLTSGVCLTMRRLVKSISAPTGATFASTKTSCRLAQLMQRVEGHMSGNEHAVLEELDRNSSGH
jgi:hypothetical protein